MCYNELYIYKVVIYQIEKSGNFFESFCLEKASKLCCSKNPLQ